MLPSFDDMNDILEWTCYGWRDNWVCYETEFSQEYHMTAAINYPVLLLSFAQNCSAPRVLWNFSPIWSCRVLIKHHNIQFINNVS